MSLTVREKVESLKPGQKFISFEFFPPKTDVGFRNLLARLNRMLALNPLFISVTWGAGGSTSTKSLDLAATCQNELGLTTVLHLTCTNTNKEVIDNALEQAKRNGIRNILALRGDPPRTQEYWTPNCDFSNAVDLIKYIKEKYGDYFCVGVAGYPEGHVDGSGMAGQDPKKDIPYLVEKIEAGAEFVITQLFYDVGKFVEYEKLVRSHPKLAKVILIPGLMPVTTYQVFTRATKLSHALIPEDILAQFLPIVSNDDEVKRLGVEVLTDIIDKVDSATEGRVLGYHFYSLNLEKAVASILMKSDVLSPVMESTSSSPIDNEEAIVSDDEDYVVIPDGRSSRAISANENGLAGDDVSAAQKSLVGKALHNDKRVLLDISTGKGALGKDATWDDFPNGRFGDSNSPAYGEIDGYGTNLRIHSPEEISRIWGNPETTKDVSKVFVNYLSGRIDMIPWVHTGLSPETGLIQEQLIELNSKGWFSVASQPAVNSYPSLDRIVGWGPRNGVVFQKAFVELFIPKKQWTDVLLPKLASQFEEKTITYYLGDSQGTIDSNLKVGPNFHNSKNAITWGVFPLKEVLQPTIIDIESFRAWNEEAFTLWLEWAKCYKKSSKSFELLHSIYTDYYLVSLIHHDFVDEYGLWEALLD